MNNYRAIPLIAIPTVFLIVALIHQRGGDVFEGAAESVVASLERSLPADETSPGTIENLTKTRILQQNAESSSSHKNQYPKSGRFTNLAEGLIRFNVFQSIMSNEFDGEWHSDSFDKQKKLLYNFPSNAGRISVEFKVLRYQPGIINPKNPKAYESIQVTLIDGKYKDDPRLVLQAHDPVFNWTGRYYTLKYCSQTLRQYHFIENATVLAKYAGFDFKDITTCQMKTDVNFSNLIDSTFNNKSLSLKIFSENCSLSISAEVTPENGKELGSKICNYSFMLMIAAAISIYCIRKITKKVLENHSEARQYSLLSIGFLMAWDAFICFSHFIIAIKFEAQLHLFIIPTFSFFALFSIFDMKLLIVLWKCRYDSDYQDSDQLRRGIISFNLKYYGGLFGSLRLFGSLLLFNLFKTNIFFIFSATLILIPQIIHNAMRPERAKSDINLYLLALSKLVVPLYYKGWPFNFLELRPSPPLIGAAAASIILQIIILKLQDKRGNKFFIPKRFLPPKFNYLLTIPSRDLETGYEQINLVKIKDDCAICMSNLQQECHSELEARPQGYYNVLRPQPNQIMRTPCDHKFHVACLLSWMSIKMECPSCRSQLPSID